MINLKTPVVLTDWNDEASSGREQDAQGVDSKHVPDNWVVDLVLFGAKRRAEVGKGTPAAQILIHPDLFD